MRRRGWQVTAILVTAALLRTIPAASQPADRPLVTAQPDPGPAVQPYVTDLASGDIPLRENLIAALRKKVRYVFVIFNENHSFDNEFGTFPGANGLFSDGTAARVAPGSTQGYTDVHGQSVTVQPFRIGPEQNATFVDSVDHSHTGLARKLHVREGVAAMDGFAADEYRRFAKGGTAGAAMGMQSARLVMSYVDCDTIPFLWQYANRFVLFDDIFATEDTPSTPNAIAMIAGQAGETQWVKHGAQATARMMQGPPLVNDPEPFWGSQLDPTQRDREPHGGPRENYADGNIASNLTFATLPLTFAGAGIEAATDQDRAPDLDLSDIGQDILFLGTRPDPREGKPVSWRWYQEGYDHEPTDPDDTASHADYVSHHDAPQYFGYIANNPLLQANLRGEGDFFSDIEHGSLPEDGGVFYIRGGFGNLAGLKPPIQNSGFPNPSGLTPGDVAAITATKSGDDDHPTYSDRQISEAMAARVVNAVARRPEIWGQSAIIITYDESDGFFDHVPPRILSYGPDGLPLARGIRVPLIVISPYARAHVVSHAEGDHNAVIETIEALFDLPPLASLPDEAQALLAGQDSRFNGPGGFTQYHLGPRDLNGPETDDLLSAFEPRRLSGELPPLPASYATIPDDVIASLPHYGGKGCAAIGMMPEDQRQGIVTQVPERFNTLPTTLPAYN